MNVGSLFSGIGGLDLGLERAGMQVCWQCEIEPYCRAVLAHHWPGVPCYSDIRDIDATAEPVDLICGGFPCQPVSLAGKGLAQEDPRWLWPEFARVVGALRPRYVLVENVPGLARRGLDIVVTGLAEMGYDAEWEIVSAAACGAPHLRERIFVVAYARGEQHESHRASDERAPAQGLHEITVADPGGERRQQITGSACGDEGPDGWRSQEDHVASGDGEGDGPGQVPGDVADADEVGRLGRARYFTEENWRKELAYRSSGGGDVGHAHSTSEDALTTAGSSRQAASEPGWWASEPDVGRVAHGVPNRLAQLRALGNAVVPQVAEAVGRMILEAA